MTAMTHILSCTGLEKGFGAGPSRVSVLRGLDLHVDRGEFLAVMGPSGCGKSTLLHVLGLMTAADGGSVRVDGQDIAPLSSAARNRIRRRTIGFVFQRFNLLGVLSGYDNVMLSLRIRGMADGAAHVAELLEQMGVAEAARRKPGEMSIGQQQRLAVVMALAHRPEILLADEPTGSLDTANSDALLDQFRQANKSGQTIVMMTHSAAVASAAGRIALMQDGKIVDQGH
jgi:putative ABC transport system ATP-binding protein